MLKYLTSNNKRITFGLVALSLLVLACARLNSVEAARGQGEDDGDNDSFDDTGFDDTGYNQPQNHDAESSHHSPQSSAEDDIDDDDEVDETQPKPVRSSSTGQLDTYNGNPSNSDLYNNGPQSNNNYNQGQQYNQYAGDQPDAYDGTNEPTQRYRRSLSASAIYDYLTSASSPTTKTKLTNSDSNNQDQRPLLRVRRSKHIGPVYTYVKTDKHAHFKWGVKHKVGKKHHG